MGMLIKKRFTRNDEARGAEAALLAVIVDKSLLDRVQMLGRPQALYRSNGAILGVDRQHRAGISGFAVEQHGTRAACSAVAHTLGAGEFKLIAQSVEQSHTRL